jgi:hypothetical protein
MELLNYNEMGHYWISVTQHHGCRAYISCEICWTAVCWNMCDWEATTCIFLFMATFSGKITVTNLGWCLKTLCCVCKVSLLNLLCCMLEFDVQMKRYLLQVPTRYRITTLFRVILRWPFEKLVDWRQCAAVMQREAVTVMPSCSGGGDIVVA